MKNLLINRALAAKKKKIFTLLLAVTAGIGTMFAVEVPIGGLYYNLDATNQTAEVAWYSSASGEIIIPSSVTYKSVPYSVTSIGDGAFAGCTGLTSVTIPNSVTSIGKDAFNGCSINTINFTGTLEDWLNTVWSPVYISNNYKLKINGVLQENIIIPNSVINIGDNAFNGCNSLASIEIPNSVTSIGNYAFFGCTGLTSVTIGNSVTSIGNYAFWYCSGLTSVTIPNSVTSIGNSAFYECIGLTSVSVESDNTVYDSRNNSNAIIETATNTLIAGCKNTIIPNSVTSIGDGAFLWCIGLTSVTIPNSVTSIGNSAFYGCSGLKNVILGTSVKVLEAKAFYNCSSIETITCYSQRPPTVNQNALYGLDYGTIVYVPADYLETYKMHDAWGLYDVRPLGAKGTETTDVNVTPAENTAEVAWPAISGAATYELVIKDKSGNVICTLIFNANGQLTQIAFHAPSRNNAPQQTQAAGFSFTVTGLEEGTSYDLTITSKDNNGGTLDTKTISFTTTGESQGINDVQGDNVQCTKVLRDGQIFILRGEKVYTLTGQEVK